MQPTFSTCGQACIAMIAGKSVEEVIKDMKTDGATSIGQLIEILTSTGFLIQTNCGTILSIKIYAC